MTTLTVVPILHNGSPNSYEHLTQSTRVDVATPLRHKKRALKKALGKWVMRR